MLPGARGPRKPGPAHTGGPPPRNGSGAAAGRRARRRRIVLLHPTEAPRPCPMPWRAIANLASQMTVALAAQKLSQAGARPQHRGGQTQTTDRTRGAGERTQVTGASRLDKQEAKGNSCEAQATGSGAGANAPERGDSKPAARAPGCQAQRASAVRLCRRGHRRQRHARACGARAGPPRRLPALRPRARG